MDEPVSRVFGSLVSGMMHRDDDSRVGCLVCRAARRRAWICWINCSTTIDNRSGSHGDLDCVEFTTQFWRIIPWLWSMCPWSLPGGNRCVSFPFISERFICFSTARRKGILWTLRPFVDLYALWSSVERPFFFRTCTQNFFSMLKFLRNRLIRFRQQLQSANTNKVCRLNTWVYPRDCFKIGKHRSRRVHVGNHSFTAD